MNQNHASDPDLIDEVERLLHEGQSSGHTVLDDLARTVPQSTPDFQQRLEDSLISHLEARQVAGSGLTSPVARARAIITPRLHLLVQELAHNMALGLLVGMISGALAGGVGGRVAMRVSALLDEPQPYNQVLFTENGYKVGKITLQGTLELIVAGALFGVFGGMFFIGIRRWLPQKLWPQGLVFSALMMAMFGSLLFNDGNRDILRFGVAWLNMLMFGAVFVVFGLLAALLSRRLESFLRRHPGHAVFRYGLVGLTIVLFCALMVATLTAVPNPGPEDISRADRLLFLLIIGASGLGILVSALMGELEHLRNANWLQSSGYVALSLLLLVGLALDAQALAQIF